jgi:hypothetical protein
VLPAPVTTAARTSRGCRAGRAILSRYTVGRMVAKPRVAANTASDSADTGMNTAKARMKSVSRPVSPPREKTSASSFAYTKVSVPSTTPAASTGQRLTANPRRRSRTRPSAR